jgi:hypothetical protein
MDYRYKIRQQVDVDEHEGCHENLVDDRQARLVADGDLPFPVDLPRPIREVFARKVARLRRTRLLKHIARAIAHDIERSRGTF